ncbi:MAG TPA: lipid A deacylase LpxR family protein [Chitinophagaceae bacterium]|nr:lipid A deacylase LpxR family protein [Chitinophagaceae bacterium]
MIRRWLWRILVAGALTGKVQAQDTTFGHLFWLSIDDDCINLRGKGTDEAYTAGINLGMVYNKRHLSKFFIDRWLPKTGIGAVNTFEWAISQLIYTPSDISRVPPAKNDYRYAGALVASHTLYSANPVKKFGIQTTVIAGVMGPPSFAEQTQTFFHHVINYRLPRGWDYQLPFDVLVNVNVTAEKMLAEYRNRAELMGGARFAAGSMEDGLTIYLKIRAGIMKPYFDGYISGHSNTHRKKRLQLYAFIQPGAELLGYYALIQGGLFNDKPSYYDDGITPRADSRKLIGHVNGGLTLAGRKFAIAVTEKIATSLLKNVRAHSVGNISIFFAW